MIKHAIVFLFSAYFVHGAELQVQFNPLDTHIEYTLGTTFHTVKGAFRFQSGNVRFDPVGGKASGLLTADATSGQSGDSARDNRMHKEILQSAKYPEITFAPGAIDGTVSLEGDSRIQVHGTFGIRGTQHEITIPAQVHIANGDVSLTSSFDIPYIEWGIKNPSTLIFRVNKTVKIDLQAVGKLEGVP
jgi:polyisoprenoid-binding protein YceI